jgi:dihydrofolate synthase/folylpolyglutamate synthase
VAWSYEQALAYLDEHTDLERLVAGTWEPPTLDRMRALVDLLASPQHAQPAVHVTGTNGKGSTVRLVSQLLAAHNLSVGTYTSPDLQRVNERLARNGEPIDDDSFAEVIEAVAAVEGLSGVRPHRFEVLTLAAFRWFADAPVDAAVVEVGLGGRWDATNVVDAAVAVVTNVGLDHTEVLGPTRADVAGEKAGIVKPGGVLVLGETDPELVPIFEREGPAATWLRDREFGCTANHVAVGGRLLDLYTPGARYDDLFVALHGAHQGDNAAVALAAAEAFFGRPLDDDVVREAFATVQVPGRFEVVGRAPLVVLDGAHNPDGARAAAATLGDFSIDGDRILVVGMNAGRDPREMLEALDARSARAVIATAADWVRAMPPLEIAEAARSLGVDAEVVPSVGAAVDRAVALASEDDLVLVAGSLYVVGEAGASFARHG